MDKKNPKSDRDQKLPGQKDTVSDINKMTIPEIARQLEDGKLNPDSLSEDKFLQCVFYLKSKCYTDAMIGEIINKGERQVRRYTKKLRERSSLNITENFQKDLLGEMVNNWRVQFAYFVRLANQDDVSSVDRMRALFYTHQIQKDIIETLGKFGYFSKEQGQADIKKAISDREERMEDLYLLPEIEMDGIPSQETLDLHNRVLEFIRIETNKLRETYGQDKLE